MHNPPYESRHSVLLASLHQVVQRFPWRATEFLKTFLWHMIMPRETEARLHDLESSAVELRLLASDQQAKIDLLFQTINEQEVHYSQAIARLENELQEERAKIETLTFHYGLADTTGVVGGGDQGGE
jgi:hypothetical protein